MMRRTGLVAVLLAVAPWSGSAAGGIPSAEERVRDSGFNPELVTWRAEIIRMRPPAHPLPERADDAPPLRGCLRYDFTLTAPVREATLAFTFSDAAVLYINGEIVAESPPYGRQGTLRVIDLKPHLRVGDNSLAYEVTAARADVMFLAEGIVFGEDGGVTRLLTWHQDWLGGWDLEDGWNMPGVDLASMNPVNATRQVFAEPSPARWPGHFQVVPPYFGRIQVAPGDLPEPIFDTEDAPRLRVRLLNSGRLEAPALTYEALDLESRRLVSQGAVALEPDGALDLAGILEHAPLPPGAYRFRLRLTDGGETLEQRDYEIASVGEIGQRVVPGDHYEDGLELREVWSVDCTAAPEEGDFIAGIWGKRFRDESEWTDIETVVEDGPAGRYRTFAEHTGYIYMAWRYRVKQLYTPHLAIIEYPDDARREFFASVVEPSSAPPIRHSGPYQRGEAAVTYIGDADPRHSQAMRKVHILFWPNEEEGSIHLSNIPSGDKPAAVARMSVHEIVNDLPALRVADAGPDRLIGPHSERGPQTVASTYYAGPLGAYFQRTAAGVDHPEFYRNWYTTTANLIKRQRFSGQNTYYFGHFMYGRTLYPSAAFRFAQDHYIGGDAVRDMAPLMLRMFERNGMSMVSCIEYICTPELIGSEPPSEAEIRAGKPTLLWVSRNASVHAQRIYLRHNWQGRVNFFHPEVQASVLTLIGELADRFGPYPAWKGVAVYLSREVGGPLAMCDWGGRARLSRHPDPLDWGYDDFTLDLFERETGIAVPVARDDPQRFEKRYDWLMAHAQAQWIDWRADQFTALYRRMRDRMRAVRPDLALRLVMSEPVLDYVGPTHQAMAADRDDLYHDYQAMEDLVKRFGVDLPALRDEEGIELARVYNVRAATPAVDAGRHGGDYELTRSDAFQRLMAAPGRSGAYFHVGIIHYGSFSFPPDKWLWRSGRGLTRQGYFWPRHLNSVPVNVLARSNPNWIMHTWMDVADSTGRIQELRAFARAYRSLPNGNYERLTGNDLDLNLWINTVEHAGAIYAYVANTDWWEKDAALRFTRDAAPFDLLAGRPVPLEDGAWNLALQGYEVRPFRMGAIADLVSAATRVPDIARKETERALLATEDILRAAYAREQELRDYPGWALLGGLESTRDECRALLAAGDVSRAYLLAMGWPLQLAQRRVRNECLEAVPFLVLGPFGAKEDTDIEKWGRSNPEVIPEYRGIETPFIGEFTDERGIALTPGFKPDLPRAHAVFPFEGRTGRWTPAIKTDYLSLAPQAHSDSPYWMVAYAYTEVYSPDARSAYLWVGSDHALWGWVNDRLILKHGGHGTSRGGQRPGAENQNRAPIRLNEGWNRILLKAVQRGDARLFFRIGGAERGETFDDLRYRIPARSD